MMLPVIVEKVGPDLQGGFFISYFGQNSQSQPETVNPGDFWVRKIISGQTTSF